MRTNLHDDSTYQLQKHLPPIRSLEPLEPSRKRIDFFHIPAIPDIFRQVWSMFKVFQSFVQVCCAEISLVPEQHPVRRVIHETCVRALVVEPHYGRGAMRGLHGCRRRLGAAAACEFGGIYQRHSHGVFRSNVHRKGQPLAAGLSSLSQGGIHTLIFVSEVKLELTSNTVFADACVLPLTHSIMPLIATGLRKVACCKL